MNRAVAHPQEYPHSIQAGEKVKFFNCRSLAPKRSQRWIGFKELRILPCLKGSSAAGEVALTPQWDCEKDNFHKVLYKLTNRTPHDSCVPKFGNRII